MQTANKENLIKHSKVEVDIGQIINNVIYLHIHRLPVTRLTKQVDDNEVDTENHNKLSNRNKNTPTKSKHIPRRNLRQRHIHYKIHKQESVPNQEKPKQYKIKMVL